MVAFLTKAFEKPLLKIGQSLGMNTAGAAGMIATLANAIPMLNILKDMNPKAKILNTAFAVSAAFVLGDHLGFTAGVEREMIFPVIIGKMAGGISAVILALLLSKRLIKNPDRT
jgi:ethanolamine transporter